MLSPRNENSDEKTNVKRNQTYMPGANQKWRNLLITPSKINSNKKIVSKDPNYFNVASK
jgi:hypothetical protein